MTNKELVLKFYDRVFNHWDFSELEDMMREDYIQHSPEVKDGREGFREFITDFTAMRPHAHIIHILEEEDMVCVFFRCTMEGGGEAKVFDLYRIQDGKLAEHWDCTMNTANIPIQNSNGHF